MGVSPGQKQKDRKSAEIWLKAAQSREGRLILARRLRNFAASKQISHQCQSNGWNDSRFGYKQLL